MTTEIESTADAAAASAAKVTTLVGAGGAAAGGWIFSNEGMALLGLIVAVAGLGLQLFLGIRRDRREQREHEARMRALERQ